MSKLQKIQDFVSRLSKKEKLLLYCAVFFISLVLLDRLVINPIFGKMRLLDEEIRKKKSSLRKDLHIISQGKRIEQLKIKYASYLIPSKSEDEELIALLKEVESLANKSSISLADLKPGGSSKEEDSSLKYYVNLSFEAQMDQLINFVYSIENSDKLLSIEKYQITPKAREMNIAQCAMTVSKIAIP